MTPLPRIMIYATPHGLGHAARQAALATELVKSAKVEAIAIGSAKAQLDFLAGQLSAYPEITLFETPDEPGLPLDARMRLDTSHLVTNLAAWVSGWDRWLAIQAKLARAFDPDLIISDCSPQPILLAKQLSRDSLFISNFTWFEVYEGLCDSRFEMSFMRFAYTNATSYIWLAGSDPRVQHDCGFFSRVADETRVAEIRRDDPVYPRMLFTFGGLPRFNIHLNVRDTQATIWTTLGPNLNSHKYTLIPQGVPDLHNFVAAADVVITKPGWATVAEAVNNRVPLVLLYRHKVTEDINTCEFLKKKRVAVPVKIEDAESQLSDAIAQALTLADNYTESDRWWGNCIYTIADEVISRAHTRMERVKND